MQFCKAATKDFKSSKFYSSFKNNIKASKTTLFVEVKNESLCERPFSNHEKTVFKRRRYYIITNTHMFVPQF